MMVRTCLWSLGLLCLLAPSAQAQDRGTGLGTTRKQAVAVRVSDGTIRVDGRLDEQVWQRAPAITDFTQKEPIEGTAPSEQMEVRFAYDDTALYLGARMYSSDTPAIQAPMGRRDDVGTQSEQIIISLDTYLDRRTAYAFGVTASGIRIDRFYANDNNESFDARFDPVWKARTRIDEQGWTAELWIPFSQLRFTNQPEQVWGLNVQRFTPTREEENQWVLVPRTDRAWASRFGELHGIAGIRPARRLELLPFVVGSSTIDTQRAVTSPFQSGGNLASRAGLDMKIGFGPSLTLQATMNPDFGQVEADPAEVNLTATPTRFLERRPFFTEDSQLFDPDTNYFYSRRIGAQPEGPASGDYVDYPSASTIIGAAKLTGRIRPRTSLGVLAAVTDDETARVANTASPGIGRVRVAPYASYGLARIQQEFGSLGSTASMMLIGVHRALDAADPLANLLTRSALGIHGDTLVRFKDGEYELTARGGGVVTRGEPGAIERIQRSSIQYAQRPDRTHARLDPTLTSLSGFSVFPMLSKVSGRHWLWSVGSKLESARLAPNDFGYLNAAEGIEPQATLRYRETQPAGILRNYSIALRTTSEWGWREGNRQRLSFTPSVDVTWKNFWTTSFSTAALMRTQDARLTRGGPLMGTPQGWTSSVSLANSAAAPNRWWGRLTIGGDEDGGVTRQVEASLSFRPSPQWQLSITPSYERLIDTQQYVTTRAAGRPGTFGSRYIFAGIARSTIASQFRMNFTLKPDLNLDVYAEPFIASGQYYDYGELLKPSSRQRLAYERFTNVESQQATDLVLSTGDTTLTLTNPDFNVRSFRSNVVLRWEWRPGSTLYVVWQQDRYALDRIGTRVGVRDMFRSITEPGTNIFLIKTSFWMPVG